MTYKNIKFSESDVMKEFEKIALDKKIIQPEIKKKASKIDISANLDVNICNLINKLSESGNFSLAEEVRSNFLEYKKAQVEDAKNELKMKKLASEVTNDMKKFYDSAHPEGSVKMDDDSESVVEDLYDSHDAIMKIVNKVNLKKKANLIKKSEDADGIVKNIKAKYESIMSSVKLALNNEIKDSDKYYSDKSEDEKSDPSKMKRDLDIVKTIAGSLYLDNNDLGSLGINLGEYGAMPNFYRGTIFKDTISEVLNKHINYINNAVFKYAESISSNTLRSFVIAERDKLVGFLSREIAKVQAKPNQNQILSFEEKLKTSRYTLDNEGNYSKLIYTDEDLADPNRKKFEDGVHKFVVTYKKGKDGAYNKDNSLIYDYGPVNKKEQESISASKQWTNSYMMLYKLYKDNLAWVNKQNDPSESDNKQKFTTKLNSLLGDIKGLYSQLKNKGDLDSPGNSSIDFNGTILGNITDVASLNKSINNVKSLLEVW